MTQKRLPGLYDTFIFIKEWRYHLFHEKTELSFFRRSWCHLILKQLFRADCGIVRCLTGYSKLERTRTGLKGGDVQDYIYRVQNIFGWSYDTIYSTNNVKFDYSSKKVDRSHFTKTLEFPDLAELPCLQYLAASYTFMRQATTPDSLNTAQSGFSDQIPAWLLCQKCRINVLQKMEAPSFYNEMKPCNHRKFWEEFCVPKLQNNMSVLDL